MKYVTKTLIVSTVLLVVLSLPSTTEARRTDSTWNNKFGSWLETTAENGLNILIKGTNKYLNFGVLSGSTGYGFRDNDGTMQFKNSSGTWTDVGSYIGSTSTTAGGVNGSIQYNDSGTLSGTNTFTYNSVLHRVGIGTTAPNNKLEITHGTSGNSGLRFTNLLSTSATSTYNGKQLSVNASGDVVLTDDATASNEIWSTTGNTGTNPTTNFIGTRDAQDFALRTNDTERMRILSNGNVGIGTTNPTSKSHIYGTSNISQTIETTSGTTDLFLKTGSANESRITFVQSGANKWQVGSTSIFDFFWYNYTQGGVQLRLKADGNTNLNEFSGKVGIGGTHTPVGMIDVRSRTATDTTAIFQGASAQTADLTEWRNGGGTTVAEVLADGTIRGLRLLAYGSGGITTNTAIGVSSLYSNTTGVNNTAIGYASLYLNTTGTSNTAIGYASLYLNTTGNQNTAVGYASLYLNTTGTSNTAIGVSSLYSNTTGTSNTALGYASLYLNTTGNQNTAVGYLSLNVNTTGVNNTAIGVSSLQSNTTANNNTAIGNSSLRYNTTGTSNTTIGVNSLYSNTTGNYNVSLGFQSLYNNTTGNQNVAIGFNTGYELNLTASENGNNVFLGYNTGRGIVTGVNNTILGANVTGLSSSLSNNIIIADGSGNRRINVDASGNVGIGTASPTAKLDVDGDTFRLRTAKTPATSTSTCATGEISWDSSYIYTCVATNSWKRATLSTF